MSKLNALGVFMDFNNRNMARTEKNEEIFQKGIQLILQEKEDAFMFCTTAQDIIDVLGFKLPF